MTLTRTTTSGTMFVACHSILELALGHPLTRMVLLDPQRLHKLVMSGFYGWVENGAPDPRAQLQILHTATADFKKDQLIVVVQSRVQPDWKHIPLAAFATKPEVITIKQQIKTGQDYTFRTVVHPTRDTYQQPGHPSRDGEQRKRRTLTSPRDVRAWFAERLQPPGETTIGQPQGVRRIGADADPKQLQVTILPEAQAITDRPAQRLTRAEIRGQLTVTDPEAFLNALTQGIGRSRSVGCGLLLAKPTPHHESVTRA